MILRTTEPSDERVLSEAIAADLSHAGLCEPSFWLSPREEERGRVECFAVCDKDGPVFYVRAENVLRLHIQFLPLDKRRTVRAVHEFSERIAAEARPKYTQIIFESVWRPLIRFLKKRGYRLSPNEWITDIGNSGRSL